MNLGLISSVGIGGAIGAVIRTLLIKGAAAVSVPNPLGTLLVNVTGGLLMGIFWAFSEHLPSVHTLRPFVAVGILGSFTTFSAYSYDFMLLIQHHRYHAAFWYFASSNGLSIGALLLGYLVVKKVIFV